MPSRELNKLTAAGFHLLSSLLIVSLILSPAYFLLFGAELFELASAGKIFLLVIVVDIVLGPLLTLIAYDPKKTKLKQDLTLIILFQLVAMIYGAYTLYSGRPSHAVFAIDRFELVRANEIYVPPNFTVEQNSVSAASTYGIKWVYAERPSSNEKRNALLFSALDGGPDLAQSAEFYRPIDLGFSDILKKSEPVEHLDESFKNNSYHKMISYYDTSNLTFVPITSNTAEGVVLIDKVKPTILGIVTK